MRESITELYTSIYIFIQFFNAKLTADIKGGSMDTMTIERERVAALPLCTFGLGQEMRTTSETFHCRNSLIIETIVDDFDCAWQARFESLESALRNHLYK